MKFTVIALELLSIFVVAKADHNLVIEDTNNFNKYNEAGKTFCGLTSKCNNKYNGIKTSVLLSLQSKIAKLENENLELLNDIKTLSTDTDAAKLHNHFADFKSISDKKPVFWLSGTYFDGLSEKVSLSRTGLAPLTDVLGNAVTKVGDVAVAPVRGKMAYMFDKTNSIMSSASVSSQFTIIVVFRFPIPPVGIEGRFCTAHVGNKLLGGWFTKAQSLYIEDWINNPEARTTDTMMLMLTNDNGVKNLWTQDTHVIVNSKIGANDWGHVVIGRPKTYENEAAQVEVYEALVFNKALDADQRSSVFTVLKRWYNLN